MKAIHFLRHEERGQDGGKIGQTGRTWDSRWMERVNSCIKRKPKLGELGLHLKKLLYHLDPQRIKKAISLKKTRIGDKKRNAYLIRNSQQ